MIVPFKSKINFTGKMMVLFRRNINFKNKIIVTLKSKKSMERYCAGAASTGMKARPGCITGMKSATRSWKQVVTPRSG